MFGRKKKEMAVSTTPNDVQNSCGAKISDAKNCGAKSTAKTVKAVSSKVSKNSCGSSAKACSGKMSSSAKACSGKSNSKISNSCKCAK